MVSHFNAYTFSYFSHIVIYIGYSYKHPSSCFWNNPMRRFLLLRDMINKKYPCPTHSLLCILPTYVAFSEIWNLSNNFTIILLHLWTGQSKVNIDNPCCNCKACRGCNGPTWPCEKITTGRYLSLYGQSSGEMSSEIQKH